MDGEQVQDANQGSVHNLPSFSISMLLTCFTGVSDWYPLPISVESRHTDRIRGIGNQVVQERTANISWNQNLFEKEVLKV